MDDLVAWLRAQLDEDEQAARAAIEAEDPRMTSHAYAWSLVSRLNGKVKRQQTLAGAPAPRERLAEVEAKRRILDDYDILVSAIRRVDDVDGNQLLYARRDARESDIRWLAQPYVDRPGYREEWRP